jgi:hypothetical protein
MINSFTEFEVPNKKGAISYRQYFNSSQQPTCGGAIPTADTHLPCFNAPGRAAIYSSAMFVRSQRIQSDTGENNFLHPDSARNAYSNLELLIKMFKKRVCVRARGWAELHSCGTHKMNYDQPKINREITHAAHATPYAYNTLRK